MGYNDRVSVDVFIGKTFKSIQKSDEGDELIFTTTDGESYRMYHEQDCCEYVSIEDIEGNLDDLIGTPILQAEELSNSRDEDNRPDEWSESWTWTFYKFATIKGYVTVRWLGESNGYYSEGVDIEKVG